MFKKLISFTVLLSLIFLIGCTVSIPIRKPLTSEFQYIQKSEKKVVIKIVDQRVDKQFHKGASKLKKAIESGKIIIENMGDPLRFLANNLEKEFNIRGIPVICKIDNTDKTEADMTLNIEVYQIVSRRVSGWSPWESYHSFKGILINGNSKHPIYAYFCDMKVPVWSMQEIVEPCFNRPISIITKEIVSKINHKVFMYNTSDEKVDSLANIIEADIGKEDNDELYLKILELGSSNNENAIEYLKKYSNASNQFLSAVTLSCIGFLGSENEFDFLVEKYNELKLIAKFMALKSIGDIGSQKSLEFIKKAKEDELYESEDGFKSCVDLYLN